MNPATPPDTGTVCYVPPQPDDQVYTSPPRARQNPLALAWRDIRTLFSVLYLLPKLLSPFATSNPTNELSLSPQNFGYLATLVFVSILGTLLCGLVLVVVTLLPGWVSTAVFWGAVGLVWAICAPIQGPMMVESRAGVEEGGEDGIEGSVNDKKGERWIFVNGVMVGNRGLANNCARLSQTFGRPITGIHNPTNGLVWDIIECIFQRSFAYNTYSIRYTYDHLKHCLTDPTVHKVVLIAHSQGGIIVSMALDLLFTNLSAENMAKLEVYTFGSAAAHFNNPMRAIQTTSAPTSTPSVSSSTRRRRTKGVIRYIEHYVNGDDIVPRWGVMYNVRLAKTRYSGRVFIRNGATGHMFNQHYLDNIFPLDAGLLPPGHNRPGAPTGFLDQVVSVDECTCRDREAYYATAAALAAEQVGGFGASAVVRGSGGGSQISGGIMSVSTGSGFCAEDPNDGDDEDGGKHDAAGMTVRELSRLWRYLGGADPDVDEGAFQ
ncbi:hypothetical protein GX51_07702 [Blastomyces parvus]|uniref:DUF676 domain-containing protein n=1 Tax=Blastomyces parvus TaxID=2060905 RepID=A0A2B7WAY1_9EURO|nr:hypothetical protein GX51_07702 [Blastomyces parvus]